jgi:hypothetical protein
MVKSEYIKYLENGKATLGWSISDLSLLDQFNDTQQLPQPQTDTIMINIVPHRAILVKGRLPVGKPDAPLPPYIHAGVNS